MPPTTSPEHPAPSPGTPTCSAGSDPPSEGRGPGHLPPPPMAAGSQCSGWARGRTPTSAPSPGRWTRGWRSWGGNGSCPWARATSSAPRRSPSARGPASSSRSGGGTEDGRWWGTPSAPSPGTHRPPLPCPQAACETFCVGDGAAGAEELFAPPQGWKRQKHRLVGQPQATETLAGTATPPGSPAPPAPPSPQVPGPWEPPAPLHHLPPVTGSCPTAPPDILPRTPQLRGEQPMTPPGSTNLGSPQHAAKGLPQLPP